MSANGASVSARTAPTAHPPPDGWEPPEDEPLGEASVVSPPEELPLDDDDVVPPSPTMQSVQGFWVTLYPPSGSGVVCPHVVLTQTPDAVYAPFGPRASVQACPATLHEFWGATSAHASAENARTGSAATTATRRRRLIRRRYRRAHEGVNAWGQERTERQAAAAAATKPTGR